MTEQNMTLLEQRVEKLEKQVFDLQTQLSQHIHSEEETEEEFRDVAITASTVTEEIPTVEAISTEEVPAMATIETEEIATTAAIATEEDPAVSTIETEEIATAAAIAPEEIPAKPKPAPEVSLEARIAKVFMPVAATALVLFAIILFGSLIKPQLTDGMKAIILSVVSLGITLFGLWKMKPETKYYRLFSALAGCGIGACYVTALVCHFVLGVLPEMGLMAIILGWIIIVSLLSKYKSRTFAYICYVGILIAAYMTIKRWNESPIGVIAYLASIATLFAANITKDYKKDIWFFIQLPAVLMAMSFSQFHTWETQFIIAATTLCSMVGQVIYYRKRTQESELFLVPTFLSYGLFIASGFQYGAALLYGSRALTCLGLLLVSIGLLVFYYRIFVLSDEKKGQCVFWLIFAQAILVLPFLDYGTTYHKCCGFHLVPSLLLMAASVFIRQRVFRYVAYLYLLLFALEVPSAMSIRIDSFPAMRMSTWVAFILMACYLYISRKVWSRIDRIILALFPLWAICQLLLDNWINNTVAYLLYSVYCIAIACTNRRMLPEQIEKYKGTLLLLANLLGFYLGLHMILDDHACLRFLCTLEGTEGVTLFLITLVTLAQALIETRRLHPISKEQMDKEQAIALYNGVKYSLLLGCLLERMDAVNYVISISGIVLAALIIVAGFRFRIKTLRVYGLLLTAFCVLKLLFFDIVFDNAFYRPISLLLAGLLLFLISFIYFRLEKLTKNN